MQPARWMRRLPWSIVALSAALMFVGWLGIARSEVFAGKSGRFLERQSLWSALCLTAMLLTSIPSYRILTRWSYAALAGSVVMLVAVYWFPSVNGAQRWIRFGPVGLHRAGSRGQRARHPRGGTREGLRALLPRRRDRRRRLRLGIVHRLGDRGKAQREGRAGASRRRSRHSDPCRFSEARCAGRSACAHSVYPSGSHVTIRPASPGSARNSQASPMPGTETRLSPQ